MPDKQWSYGTSEDYFESDVCPSRECAILCGFMNNSDAETIFIAAHVPSEETLLNIDMDEDLEEFLYNFAERTYLHEDIQERLQEDTGMKVLSTRLKPILAEAEQVFQRWIKENNVQALVFSDEEEVPRSEYERLLLLDTQNKERARAALDLAVESMDNNDFKRAQELIEEARRALEFPEIIRGEGWTIKVEAPITIISDTAGFLFTDVAPTEDE